MRCWSFITILTSTFAPGLELYYSMLNFLSFEIRNSSDKAIVMKANYALSRLLRIFSMRRRHIPSDNELKHIEEMKPIMLPIYFFSDTHTYIETESYTSVRELKQKVMNKLELLVTKIPYYSLYEVCEKENVIEERFFDDNDRVVDILAVWSKEAEQSYKVKSKIEFRFYLKIMIFYDYPEDDFDSITMLYLQSCYEVINSRYEFGCELASKLASLQLLINFNLDRELASNVLTKSMKNYVPLAIYSMRQPSEWIAQIYSTYLELPKMSAKKAKTMYLELLSSNPLYLCHQFNCKVLV